VDGREGCTLTEVAAEISLLTENIDVTLLPRLERAIAAGGRGGRGDGSRTIALGRRRNAGADNRTNAGSAGEVVFALFPGLQNVVAAERLPGSGRG